MLPLYYCCWDEGCYVAIGFRLLSNSLLVRRSLPLLLTCCCHFGRTALLHRQHFLRVQVLVFCFTKLQNKCFFILCEAGVKVCETHSSAAPPYHHLPLKFSKSWRKGVEVILVSVFAEANSVYIYPWKIVIYIFFPFQYRVQKTQTGWEFTSAYKT